MFYWSAAVAYIVIHLNIFIFEIDFFMNENGFLTVQLNIIINLIIIYIQSMSTITDVV